MKFALDSNHRDFFQKNLAIEFDGLLDEKHLIPFKSHINMALAARLKEKKEPQSPENLFMAGRDLWRMDASIRKIDAHRKFAEIASELITHKPLRLGYDQYIPAPPAPQVLGHHRTPYDDLLHRTPSLEEISSLQGLLCGLMLCIQAPDTIETQDTHAIFSAKAGNGVFFSPQAIIDFQALVHKRQGFAYILIVYVQSSTVYILNTEDPHAHTLKNYGYVFGDKLSDKSNPIIYR